MKPAERSREYFFERYLDHAPVALAFWRAFECYCFSRVKIEGPVLDVGCGDGFFAQTVFAKPLEAGIDLDPREAAKAAKSGAYLQVVQGSATGMPFPDRRFKTVISNCVLEHVPDIDAALGEIRRVLKPGGRFYLTVPSECFNENSYFKDLLGRSDFPGLGEKYLTGLNRIFKHHHVDKASVWEKRLRKAGFKMERAEYSIPLEAFHVYERWLIPAFPAKILKLLWGRWVIGPRGPVKWWARRWMRGKFEVGGGPGAIYFIAARKA